MKSIDFYCKIHVVQVILCEDRLGFSLRAQREQKKVTEGSHRNEINQAYF